MKQNRYRFQAARYLIPALMLLVLLSGSAAALTVQADPPIPITAHERALLEGRVLPVDSRLEAQTHPAETQFPAQMMAPATLSGMIAFSSDRSGPYNLFAQTTPGNLVSPLVASSGSDVTPRWSPDGKELLFASNRDGDFEIYLRTAAGVLVQLTQNTADDAHPAWAPSGDHIYFTSNRAGEYYRIYRMNRTGADVQQVLAISGQHVLWPGISPDGQRLAYMQASMIPITCLWNWDVWVLNLDGSGRRQITTHFAGDFFPAWSPDGREIIYSGCKNFFDADLYAINPDTRAERRLNAWFGSDEWGATFSPDRQHLAFNSNKNGNQDIYVIDLAQGGAFNFSAHAASDLHPSWTGPTPTSSPTPTSTPTPTITPTPGAHTFMVSGVVLNGVIEAKTREVSSVVVSTDTGFRATTDDHGRFLLSGLPAGRHNLSFSKQGWGFPDSPLSLSLTGDVTVPDILGYKIPIVLVHGIQVLNFDIGCGPYEPSNTFGETARLLKQEGGYWIEYASLVTSPCYTPSLRENVPNLIRAIERAKTFTRQEKVILIGHSMGGLVSRLYVEGDQYREDVEKLFTFGSPHWGIPEELVLYLLGPKAIAGRNYACIFQEAICDFSFTGMFAFNIMYSIRNSNIHYYAISGDAPDEIRKTQAKITGLLLLGADDGTVHTWSGTELPGEVNRYIPPELHGSSLGSQSYFSWESGSNPKSYDECLKQVLISPNPGRCGTMTSLSANSRPLETQITMAPIAYGTLLPMAEVTHTFVSEGGMTLFVTQWISGTLGMHLVDPNGSIMDPNYAQAHPDEVTYDAESGWAGYEIAQAQAGVWQVVLQATDIPANGSDYAIFSTSDTGLAFTAAIDRIWYTPGQTAAITATLDPPPLSGSITATIQFPGGVTDTVRLDETSRGNYTAAVEIPDAPGYADARLVAVGQAASGLAFERGRVLAFQISPDTIALTGAYSDQPVERWPGATVYDALEVTAEVSVTLPGDYALSADLVDASGQFVAHHFLAANLSAGLHTVVFRFGGSDIYAAQHNGPYTLTHLILSDQRGVALVVGEFNDVYETAPYAYTDFRLGDFFLPLLLK